MLWAVYALCLNEECAYTCTLRAWFGQRLPWASVKLGLSSQGGSCVTVKDDNPLDVVASVARIYIHHSPFPLERNIWWPLIWMCFFALWSSSSCGSACLSLYQQHIFGDIEFEVASMSCQHVKFPCVFEDCSVPFLRGRLLWVHVHSWLELWNVHSLHSVLGLWSSVLQVAVSPAVQTSFRLPGWLDFVTSQFDKILQRKAPSHQVRYINRCLCSWPVWRILVKNPHVWGKQNKRVPFILILCWSYSCNPMYLLAWPEESYSQIVIGTVLATAIRILTLAFCFGTKSRSFPSLQYLPNIFLWLSGSTLQSQNKNIFVGTDTIITPSDVAQWFDCSGATVSAGHPRS